MKFTENAINVLKNFQRINDSIVIEPGNVIKTLSNDKTVLSTAQVDMEFPEPGLSIFNLPSFLQVLSLLEEPSIEIGSEQVKVTDKNSTTYSFRQAKKSLIVHTEKNEIPMEDLGSFTITWDQFNHVMQAARALQVETVCFYTFDNHIYFGAFDPKETDSDAFSIKLSSTAGNTEFKFYIDINKFNLLPDDYSVTYEPVGRLVRMESKAWNSRFWVALESVSVKPSNLSQRNQGEAEAA
jgi:hypothetical protein